MKLVSIGLVVLAGLSLVGCSQSKLSGKWNMSSGTANGNQTIEFTDKAFTLNSVIGKGAQEITLKILGTYTLETEKLVLKADSATVDDSKLPENLKKQVKMFITPDKIVESLNKNGSFGIKFTDNDTATHSSSSSGSSNLTRIKS